MPTKGEFRWTNLVKDFTEQARLQLNLVMQCKYHIL